MGAELTSVWRRRGQILAPSHLDDIRMIQSPTAWELPNGLVRIAVACRNTANLSFMRVMECDPAQNMRIVQPPRDDVTVKRALAMGGLSGLGPCDALWDDGQLVLVTSSITRQSPIYDAAIEIMTSADGGATFSDPQTILTSAANGGYPVSLPCIRRQDNGLLRMWFTAFTQWFPDVQPHPDARYCIRSATSADGLSWSVDPDPAITWLPGEAGLARPTVQRTANGHEMWFCSRGPYVDGQPELRRYRLCFAWSPDGMTWRRQNDGHAFSNPPDPGDWDDQMQCYPFVLRLSDGRQVMFYCGNAYGQTGIGWAVRDEKGG